MKQAHMLAALLLSALGYFGVSAAVAAHWLG
jgi:hypothetical protein